MAIGHQSPGFSLPSFRMKQLNTTTWGSGGNTKTITDEYIHANSAVIAYVTGSTPAAGNWSYSIPSGGGSVTITSSDAESSTLAIAYIVL